ncbi:MAG: hypothetical protein ACYCWE_09795 [Eubacteriales bacterium]
MRYLIKSRVAALGKKLTDLHTEVEKTRKVDYGNFTSYISGKKTGETADAIIEIADKIVTQWERRK